MNEYLVHDIQGDTVVRAARVLIDNGRLIFCENLIRPVETAVAVFDSGAWHSFVKRELKDKGG